LEINAIFYGTRTFFDENYIRSYSQFCGYYSFQHGRYFGFFRLLVNDVILNQPGRYFINVGFTVFVGQFRRGVLNVLCCVSVVSVLLLVVVDHIGKVTVVSERFSSI